MIEAAGARWSFFCIRNRAADVIMGAKLDSAAVGPLQEPDPDGQSQRGKGSPRKSSSSSCASPCCYSCFGIRAGVLDPAHFSKTQLRHFHVPPATSAEELQAHSLLGVFSSLQSGCAAPFTWPLPKQLLIRSQKSTIKRLGERTNSI